ncbi:hypothetical protein Q7P37_001847 [Cladosporium fusiforme]
MSLNGLDAPPVSDAYYAAIVEAGGWFLLKYTSRDEVELLAKGKGGVSEARNELLKYEDKSPLYGLIVYRRRKVLIKFIPDGTSRLLQARTAVHFQTVAEKYAPYETLLEITNADELSDTSLASSFPLHTASPALSTTRLDEISEDAEDGGAGGSASAPKAPARTKSSTSSKYSSGRYKSERRVDHLMRSQQHRPASPLSSSEMTSGLPTSPTSGIKSSISQFLVRDESGTRSITPLTPSGASVTDYAGSIAESDVSPTRETETIPSIVELPKVEDQQQEHDNESTPTESDAPVQSPSIREASPERSNEATERPLSGAGSERSSHMPELFEHKSIPERPKPDLDEPFDFSYLEPKPKIKLGPRPVAAATDKPRKSATMGTSALPAGYRPAKKQEQQRPVSTAQPAFSQSNGMPGMSTLLVPPPIPSLPEYSPRPVSSRGSVKSVPSQKSSSMTPDKVRLMKAVELRRKQMRKSNPQIRTAVPTGETPEVPKIVEKSEPDVKSAAQNEQEPANESPQSPKPDSGIEIDENQLEEQREEHVPTDQPDNQEEVREQEPTVLLTSPVAGGDSTNSDNHTVSESEPTSAEARPRSLEVTADVQQHAGADNTGTGIQTNTEPETSNKSPTPPQDASINQADPSGDEVSVPPTEQPTNSNAIDQTVEEPEFTTSAFEDMMFDVPEIVTTASSRPQTAQDPTSIHDGTPDPSSMESSGTLESLSDKQISDLAKRRRGLVDPLYINVDTRRSSVAESLSDNDFLEELQSATFHDAREMSVSKSPGAGSPFFPLPMGRNSSYDSAGSHSRSPVREISISNSLSQTAGESSLDQHLWQRSDQDGSVSPDPTQLAFFERSHLSASGRQSPAQSLRRNVSSGITRRIQALNELSSRETSPVPVHIPTRTMSPDQGPVYFANDRKPSMRAPHVRTGSSLRVRPHVERIGSSGNALQQPEVLPVWNTSQDTTSNRDSVSVKARIVRPSTAGGAENGADSPANLHESQIEINHLRGTPTPTSVSQAFLPPMPSVPADPPSPDHRSVHSLRRKSFGRSKASTPGPTPANEEVRSGSTSTLSIEEPSGSRTSRFFKRMSNFGSNASKRRSLVGPSVTTLAGPQSDTTGSVVNSATTTAVVDRDTPPAVQVGDLNIQFPDTLLWKRRWLSLDESGFVHLSPPTSQQPHLSQGRPGKKFHLSDFKAPYAPDLDRQELPHSVCLEFTGAPRNEEDVDTFDGGILQVACEDAMGQRHVLKLLGGYWKSWVTPETATK